MPSVSTSNIIYKSSNLGMGIAVTSREDKTNREIIDKNVIDSTRDNCCKPPVYTAADIDVDTEKNLETISLNLAMRYTD